MKGDKPLFSRLFGKKQDDNSGSKGEILLSPLSGKVIPIEQVGDATFSQKILGDGVAIEPTQGKVVSPVDGEISTIMDTKHAVCITSKTGIEILIHIGQDTVELNGQGFTAHVKEGDNVKCGDLLIEFDINGLKQKNIVLTTPVVVTNSDDYSIEKVVVDEISSGEKLLTLNKQ